MIDGRVLLKKAVEELNASKVLSFIVDVSTIDTANDEELTQIISHFLDSVETVPERKENLLPRYVITAYNTIVDKAASFDIAVAVPFNIDDVVFKRTKFPV